MNEQEFFIYEASADGSIIVDDHLTLLNPTGQKSYSHHDCFEIYYFEQGELAFSAEGSVIDIVPGDLVLVRPHVMHGVLIKKHCCYHRKHIFFQDSLFLMTQPGALALRERLLTQPIHKLEAALVHESGMDILLNEVIRSICCHTPYEDFCAVTALYRLLILGQMYRNTPATQTTQIRNQKLYDILQYIDTHIAEPLDYRVISDLFYVSEKNLYYLFKKETGLSPARYINERRMIKAKLLMQQGYSATEAAESTGYQDYSVFYRNFRKTTGISPSDFQNGVSPQFNPE